MGCPRNEGAPCWQQGPPNKGRLDEVLCMWGADNLYMSSVRLSYDWGEYVNARFLTEQNCVTYQLEV